MNEGLLWFDADPKRDLAAKVTRAADRYQQKFGHRPNLCYVHASQVDGLEQVAGVRVVGAKNTLKHHFWIGLSPGDPEGENEQAEREAV